MEDNYDVACFSMAVFSERSAHFMIGKYSVFSRHAGIPVSLGAILSFLFLSAESVWLDEAYSIADANLSWPALFSLIVQLEANMSIYHVLLKIWISVFGDSEFAVRSLSAIFLPGTVGMIYALARKLFDSNLAFVAAMLMATHSFAIHYAQEARSYSLLLFLSTLSIYLLVMAIESKKVKYVAWLGVVNAAMLYAHLYGAFVILLQVAAIALAPKSVELSGRFVFSYIILLVFSLPLAYLALGAEGNPWAWATDSSLINIVSALKALMGGALFIAIPISLCVAIALVTATREFRATSDRWLLWKVLLLALWVGLPIGGLYVLSKFGPAFENRYLITALPAVVILAALGVSRVKHKVGQASLFAALIALSILNVALQYASTSKIDWRTVAHTVLADSRQGDGIMFYGWMAKYPFDYYYRRYRQHNGMKGGLICVWPSPFVEPQSEENVGSLVSLVTNYTDPSEQAMKMVFATHQRLWVVLAMDKIPGMGLDSGPILQMLQQEYEIEKDIQLSGVRVMRLAKGQYPTNEIGR